VMLPVARTCHPLTIPAAPPNSIETKQHMDCLANTSARPSVAAITSLEYSTGDFTN
jgi:hypothetical protein